MIFDAHIHLEKYPDEEVESMVGDPEISGLIAVSMDPASSRRTLELKRRFPEKVFAACGFHPEQEPADVTELETFIRRHAAETDAVGEVGLPYYRRREAVRRGEKWNEEPDLEILERMIRLAAELDKPVILHGVREDVNVICGRLEAHRIKRAHFHWLKANGRTLERLAARGYFVSSDLAHSSFLLTNKFQ
jgi:TatD DNase family protein